MISNLLDKLLDMDIFEASMILLLVVCIGVLAILPVVVWKNENYWRDHNCYYTGETRTSTILVYNAALKMTLPQTRTEKRYECSDAKGGWR